MNQYQTERRLCWFYGLLVLFLSVSVICIAIPFNHWRASLDVCPGGWLEYTNCGCILFSISGSQYFNGGHNSYCHYAVFAPLPILVYAIVMVMFHMYRVCINNVGQYEDEKSTAMDEIEGESIVVTSRVRATQRNDAVIYCWIPTSCLGAVFGVYNIVYAGIVTAGFLKTCNQYRVQLVRDIPASGEHASVIHFRLTCQAIFDFMDYIQAQRGLPNTRINTTYINTGVSLQLAVIAAWLAVAMWIAITVYTAVRAYRERHVLTCCGN